MRWFWLLVVLLSPAQVQVQAQVQPKREQLGEAFALERQGQYAAAADVYRSVLAGAPGNVGALLGLERALLSLGRVGEILPQVRLGLEANPNSGPLYGIALRAWAAEGTRDSARAIAERWARVAPGDESPYREWGAAAIAMRDRATARVAYRLGRERLGTPDALATELAELATAERDYPTALDEWVQALQRIPDYQSAAVAGLALVPASLRPELLDRLAKKRVPAARRLEAGLRAQWGDPLGGFATLERALPADREHALEMLQAFVDQVRTLRTADARLAQGRALEAMAARSPPPQAARLRVEAADVYTQGGDRRAARRMLVGLADDYAAPGAAAAGATLVAVLIGDGKLDEAERRLAELQPVLAADQYRHLQRELALGWARSGAFARADAALAADSSVDGLATSGWLRLYRGDIRGAIERFKAAGPFAGGRAEATQRTGLLALLQPIEADSAPELGRAFLALARGDTSAAVTAFETAAAHLPPAGGAEVRLYAGRLAAAAGRVDDAERLLRAAAVPDAPGTAPAAELALSELLVARQRTAEAVQVLEHLILTYPESALAAQARRKLDQARGALPKT